MRGGRRPSELGRLAKPAALLLDWLWQRMHWWIGAMAIMYLGSGISVIKSDEVGIVLRWGRLVGETPALQEHGPGVLFALPRPIDEVVRVQVKHVAELDVATLNTPADKLHSPTTLDPVTEGYALTGDHNIVHALMVARYRIRAPADWALHGPSADQVLRVAVTAAMVRALGEMGVDSVLADGRKSLIAQATRRAQAGLDAAHSGLELTSLELTRLSPPQALARHFDAVQSAFIGAETQKKQAQAAAERSIPQAQAAADAALQEARASAATELAQANGEAGAFLALADEYHENPTVVRERLYRDAVERAIAQADRVQWIPAPTGARYTGLRVSVSAGGLSATASDDGARKPGAPPRTAPPSDEPSSE